MKILKIMIVLLILTLSVGAVCAAENSTSDVLSADSQEVLEITPNEVYSTGDASFSDLKDEIDNASTYLELTKDYAFNNETDDDNGIFITKSNFVLNGEGHTIDAKFQSRIFVITGNNITISNLNLINGNKTGGFGGAINSTGTLTLNDIIFNNNHAGNGGALYIGGETTINNALFSENKAENGGAILIQGETEINNVTFNNNHADAGGALYIDGETTINDSIFNNNNATNGGAILAQDEAKINNSTFNNNQAENGGAIFNKNYTTEITYCEFSNNTAEWGGSVYSSNKTLISNSAFSNAISKYAAAVYAEGNISIKNSTFEDLYANQTAGAIGVKSLTDMEINNCTFSNTAATKNGGAIFIDIDSKPIETYILNSMFINSTGDFGGALVQLGGNISIINSIFINNTAQYDGGAIFVSNTLLSMNNTIFESNKLMDNETFNGGAIYLDDSVFNIFNSDFDNNTKNAIYTYDSYGYMDNSTFKNNGEAIHCVFAGNNTFKNITLNNDIMVLNDTNYLSIMSGNGIKLELINNTINVTNLPARFDLRDWEWLTPVKNQGAMGSCWVFGVSGGLESELKKATGVAYDFSENNIQNTLLQYSKIGVIGNEEGGYLDEALSYFLSWIGPFPKEYDTYDELGKLSPILFTDKNIHIQDAILLKEIKNSSDIEEYKKAVMKYGAIAITYYAYQEAPYYNNKTAAQYQNNTTQQDHSVSIVGWDDTFSKENFIVTPPGDGAWIIKNSWDTDWGDKGYGYISYYDIGMVGYKYNPIFIIENTENYTTNYQTDLGGSLNIEEYSKDVSYKVNYEISGNELVSAVGTYFANEDEEYLLEIYLNNELVHTQNGTAPYRGYHTVKLTKEIPVKAKDIITAIMTKESIPFINKSRQHYLENVSFVNYGGEWEDPVKENKTFTLKVYTKNLAIYTEDLVKIYKNDSNFEANIGVANETVTFEINGRNYTRVSDENGTALMTINLEPGNYTIKTMFNGTAVENNITVLPTLIADNLVKYYRNASQFYIYLIDGEGNSIADINITMNINGVLYNRTTNENGSAKLNINLPPGEYILTAIDPITGLQMSYTITVLPTLSAADLEMKYKDGSTFNATVVDGQGNPLKGAIVKFNINGVLYNRTTDAKGIAKLNINLISGKYIITSEYDGLKISNTITIKG